MSLICSSQTGFGLVRPDYGLARVQVILPAQPWGFRSHSSLTLFANGSRVWLPKPKLFEAQGLTAATANARALRAAPDHAGLGGQLLGFDNFQSPCFGPEPIACWPLFSSSVCTVDDGLYIFFGPIGCTGLCPDPSRLFCVICPIFDRDLAW